jgi:hypothetical protein
MASQIRKKQTTTTMTSSNKKVIVPEYMGPATTAMEKKKFGNEIGASHFSPDFSKNIIKPVKEWKFSFGRFKNIQLQDAEPTSLKPWCRWLIEKLSTERPISAAYAQAYLDGKTLPTVCNWSTNEYPFLTVGRYRGFPINMVAVEHKNYFKWLLTTEMSASLSDAFKEYIETYCINQSQNQ